MAFVQDTQNDPNQQQPATSGATNQLPQTSSGTGGGATSVNTSGAGAQGVSSVPNASKAPPVQNLSDYLTANAPQAAGMGQAIAQNLSNQGQQVTGDINSNQQTFDKSVQASNVAPNTDLVSRAAQSPTDFVQNPNDVQAFQAQRDANYTGPTSFESADFYEPLTQEVQTFQNNAPNVENQSGILQLVSGQEQNPTLGMENLDALLLGGTPEALNPIRHAESQYSNLGDILKGAGTT